MQIVSANLNANIPVRSADDFSFSFYIKCDDISAGCLKAACDEIASKISGLECPPKWGDNPEVAMVTNEKEYPGISRQLVSIFQAAGIEVTAMGTNYRPHPVFDSIQVPDDIAEELKSYEAFEKFCQNAIAQYKP